MLLALTEGLFDSVPLDQMREAERALCAASTQIVSRCERAFRFQSKTQRRGSGSGPESRSPITGAFPKGAMSDTQVSLRRKIDGAVKLESVVRTMKAVAASSIGQYEAAVRALADYERSVELGLSVCFRQVGTRCACIQSVKEARD